jgi:hypothetical protein
MFSNLYKSLIATGLSNGNPVCSCNIIALNFCELGVIEWILSLRIIFEYHGSSSAFAMQVTIALAAQRYSSFTSGIKTIDVLCNIELLSDIGSVLIMPVKGVCPPPPPLFGFFINAMLTSKLSSTLTA